VGYILIGVAASTAAGNAAVLYFIPVYIVSNLGAFAVISAVSSATGKEEISDYRGFYKTNPVLSWVLLLSLFSLAGIPPAAGFFGKFFLLTAGASKGMVVLVVVAAVNIVVSLYYYLLVVKAMFIDKSDFPIEKIKISYPSALAMIICLAGIMAMGLIGDVYEYLYALCK
jgi:NADH-quinone oxidoreductase subunit N